jgi:2-methylcitrate dehydratase PrpD
VTAVSRRIANFAVGLDAGEIPQEVADAAKLHLLDALGAGIAAHALGIATAGRDIARAHATGPSTLIGSPTGASPEAAALANGMLCHGIDFDDTHAESICHISVVVAPAALAVAEARAASGRDLLAALVVGNEIVARVGTAAAPGYMKRGFHPTSVCGVFGAAAATARLLGLDAEATSSALGVVASMAGGIFAYLGDGTATKPVHAGWAAHAGVLAAQLAGAGAQGPPHVFEDRFGFFAAYYDPDAPIDAQVSDFGDRWETPRIAFKPYPACHFIHSTVDAAAALLAETPVAPEDVTRITVAVPEPGIALVLDPLDAKRAPRTDYEAKFSLPYSVAALLVHGEVGVETYTDEAIADPVVLALAAKVDYVRRDFPTFPQSFPGWIRIETASGAVYERDLAHQRGGPDNPMTREDVARKFRRNAELALDEDVAAAIEESVLSLEELDDVRPCLALLGSEVAGAVA